MLGVTLVRGRTFDDRQAFSDAPVAVIDERAAARLWPGEYAVGKLAAEHEGRVRTVIGVVGTVRTQLDVDDAELDGTAYLPIVASNPVRWSIVLLEAPSAGVTASLRDAVQRVNRAASSR